MNWGESRGQTNSANVGSRETYDGEYVLVRCQCGSIDIVAGWNLRDSYECSRCGTKRDTAKWLVEKRHENFEKIAEMRSLLLARYHSMSEKEDLEAKQELQRADYGVLSDRVDERFEDGRTVATTPDLARTRYEQAIDPGDPPDTDSDTAEADDQSTNNQEPIDLAKSRQLRKGADSRSPGIREVVDDPQLPVEYTEVEASPRYNEWLPDLLTDRLPQTARLVREIAADAGVERKQDWPKLVDEMWLDWLSRRETESVDEEVKVHTREYYLALLRFAHYGAGDDDDERTTLSEREQAKLRRSVTEIATGDDPLNSSQELLSAYTALRSRAKVDTLYLSFDGSEWVDGIDNQPETAGRALEVIDELANVFDIRLWASEACKSTIRRYYPEWADEHLTERDDTQRGPQASVDCRADRGRAWEAIRKFADHRGCLSILDVLANGEEYTYNALVDDDRIPVGKDALYQDVPALEDEGLVEVDESRQPHQIQISELGNIAVGLYLEGSEAVRHPQQTQLGADSYSNQNPSNKNSVTTGATWEGVGLASALADTPSLSSSSEASPSYASFLPSPDGVLPSVAHRRLSAVTQGCDEGGVTLVDQPNLEAFDDGRATYYSHWDDHVLSVVQWGGALPVMGRIVDSLVSRILIDDALSVDVVGEGLEELLPDLGEEETLTLLHRASQIGWLSEEDFQDRSGWKRRYLAVAARAMERVKQAQAGNLDAEGREDLFKDLHGIRTAMAFILSLAGKDLSIHIRVPDAGRLTENETQREQFVDFIRYVVPKHAAYDEVHSSWRNLHDQREEKLNQRIIPDVDPDQPGEIPTGEGITNFVIAADDTSPLEPLVEEGLSRAADDVRPAVANGDEDQFVLDIPVRDGNGFAATKQVLKQVCEWKQMEPIGKNAEQSYRRLARTYAAILGGKEHGPSPFDVAESLLLLQGGTEDEPERITVGDVASGLGMLPADQLLPAGSKPTIRQMLSVLLSETGPNSKLSRQEIQELAEVSEPSLENLDVLAGFDLVEQTESGEWRATIEPWWTDGNARDEPYERPSHPDDPPTSYWQDIVDAAVHRSGIIEDLPPDTYATLYCESPRDALETVGWAGYWPLLKAYSLSESLAGDDLPTGTDQSTQRGSQSRHRLGTVPSRLAPEQQTLQPTTA